MTLPARKRRSARGFTLIEALIALALLMAGVYVVFQVFPLGLGTAAYARSMQVATRLAEQEVERLLAEPGALPQQIVATDGVGTVLSYEPSDLLYSRSRYSAGQVSVSNGSAAVAGSGTQWLTAAGRVVPGCLFRVVGDDTWYLILSVEDEDQLTLHRDYAGSSDASADYEIQRPSWEPDSVFLPRTIVGETVEIPHQAPAAGVRELPKHVLTFGPILPLSQYDPANPERVPVDVYSTRYTRVDDEAQLSPDGEHFQYAIDYETGVLKFDTVSAYDRKFKVDYSWVEMGAGAGEKTTTSRVGERFTVLAGNTTYTLSAILDADQHVVAGSERIHRLFDYDPTGTPGQGEFTMSDVDQVLGVVRFSPDDAGTTVMIDYRVADWQIMREDKTVGAGGDVQLGAFPIRKASYRNEPREAQALYVDWPNAHDIVAVDLDSGEALYGAAGVQAFGSPDGAGYMGTFELRVNREQNLDDYRSGRLRFGTARADRTYRIYYRAEENWGVQVGKAAGRYYATATAGAQANQRYALTKDGSAQRARLAFQRSEWGKTVMVDYTFYPVAPSPGERHSGELHTVPKAGEDDEGVVVLDTAVDFDGGEDIGIHKVTGASLTAGTVWANTRRRSLSRADVDPGIPLQEKVMIRRVETFAADGR